MGRKSALAVAGFLLSLWPALAGAHAILIDSSPPVNATIAPGHVSFTLRYNSRIDRERSRLTLVAPDRSETRLPIGADGAADIMTTAADLGPGAYTVRWQVLAVDGHITRGDVPITVKAP
ncbi:MAG: copper resistance CopC family protein [Acetobacteraceae bacterium]